jgi:hypothetical protein
VLQFINCDNGTDNRAVHSIYGRIGGSCRTNFIVFDPDAATTPESDEFCWALLPRDLTNGPPTSSRYPTTPWLHLWATTSGAKTVTIEAMAQMSSMPTNAEVWLEVKYLDDAGDVRTDLVSTQALFSGAAAVANTASSHAWDCVNTRVDSASYSIGDVFKVGTNAGRVFYCTTGGAATSPIPAAYASATDGTAVTDGTATFEAMRRMTLTAAFTVARSGPVAVRVCDARRLSTMTILYVSPSPVIA